MEKTGKIKPQIKWTQERKDYLIKNWPNEPLDKIREYFVGVSYSAIKSQARALGIKRIVNPPNNLSYFEGNTPDVYYWLGFIMADGNVNKKGSLRISLHRKDLYHLCKLANVLKKSVKLTVNKDTYSGKIIETCILQVGDKFVCDRILDTFKIVSAKTYSAIDISSLDTKEKFMAFFCGFSDGDAVITFNKKTNSFNMLRIQCHMSWIGVFNLFKEKLTDWGIESKVSITKKGFAEIVFHKKKYYETICNFVKENMLPVLDRKWKILNYETKSIFIENKSNIRTIKRAIIQLNKNFVEINRFDSIRQAAIKIGVDKSSISRACKDNLPCKESYWKYVE